jgi:hypothetical protein
LGRELTAHGIQTVLESVGARQAACLVVVGHVDANVRGSIVSG